MSEVVISVVVHETPEQIRPQDIKRIEEEITLETARLFSIALHRDPKGRLSGSHMAAPQVYVGLRA